MLSFAIRTSVSNSTFRKISNLVLTFKSLLALGNQTLSQRWLLRWLKVKKLIEAGYYPQSECWGKVPITNFSFRSWRNPDRTFLPRILTIWNLSFNYQWVLRSVCEDFWETIFGDAFRRRETVPQTGRNSRPRFVLWMNFIARQPVACVRWYNQTVKETHPSVVLHQPISDFWSQCLRAIQ